MAERGKIATWCVHGGEIKGDSGAPHTPIYNSTTFRFKTTADIVDAVQGRTQGGPPPLYTRYGFNPSIMSLEEKLAGLEGAEAALAFSSGMAAEAAAFMAHGRAGIVCIGDAYGGTLELLDAQLPLLGIRTSFLLGNELHRLDGLLDAGARLVFLETPTNPTLEIFDIRALAERAHAKGALLMVDNTFASPINQRPLDLGADLAVHSATKYLGGHSDITAGALMGPAALVEPVWGWRKNLGTTPAPETAALLARSLRTLPIRVERQNQSALAVARTMQKHPKVVRVLHPGLPDFPGHELAARQMAGFGGMLSIEIAGGEEEATAFVDRLKLISIAASLGGVESLATQPVTTTHSGLSEEERRRRGITGALVRFSIGLEDPDDLIADLEHALS